MHVTEAVCSVTEPILLCVVVSQNDTDLSAAAAMNVPLLARTTDVGRWRL